ncbi:MAG TPA: cupredoxin domain-containing protein [Roseiarcus sp.]|nr:cupredoxin domain-containing protein [Roseiarcus sp.]
MRTIRPSSYARRVAAFAIALLAATQSARAEEVVIHLVLKDHRFQPQESSAPAGQRITIELTNQDPTPAELESKTLRFEKVVAGGGKITMQVRPLVPGRYRFYDDYHEDTTEGFLVVR